VKRGSFLKLAIVTTHPIQYYAPVFRLLAQQASLSVRVFYTWNPAGSQNYDPGFGKAITWDIPLLEGYEYSFVHNTSSNQSSSHFRGIVNPGLIPAIESWGAQAVLVFGWSYHSHLQTIRYFKGKIPVFFRGDSHLLDERAGIKTFLRRQALSWVYRHIDYAFYVGHQNKQYFKVHGLHDQQLYFAPHAIDIERFVDKDGIITAQAESWRHSLGISSDELVFLFAGKLEPKKNPILLLNAFVALQAPRTHLLFVGNGVMESELKSRAAAFPTVHFLDFQNQSRMPLVYRLGNVFVLPSQGPGETWGLAVNEAMTCGLPVIVSDKVGCAIDLVHFGVNGYIFTSNDEEKLHESLRNFVNHPDSVRAMGEQSYQIIQKWSIPVMVAAITKALIR
jgi:glycosyltransferase involved in cell wall biosynthesis